MIVFMIISIAKMIDEHNFINMNDISVIFGIKIGIKINDLIIKKCDKSYIKTMSKLVSRIYALKY